LKGLAVVGRDDAPMPFYIEAAGPPAVVSGRKLLAFANRVVDLDAVARREEPRLLPHDPRWFGTSVLPYDFVPGAGCPGFLRFVRQVLERDPETGAPLEEGDRRLEVVQEWLGYSLLPDG